MVDYKRMYHVLCKAADGVIEPLKRIPLAEKYADALENALLEAEEIYIESSTSGEGDDGTNIIYLNRNE